MFIDCKIRNDINQKKHTLSISSASTTLVQSLSAILNADQGMHLTS